MPSPVAKRIKPVITEEFLKKIQAATKVKENRIKKAKKEGGKPDVLTSVFNYHFSFSDHSLNIFRRKRTNLI